jgi:hypothetical protein
VKRGPREGRPADLPSARVRVAAFWRRARTPGDELPSRMAEPLSPAAREWNLWELERKARELAGNTARDEEWNALFTNLRIFADADGVLPKEFDRLVRESFGELIEAP